MIERITLAMDETTGDDTRLTRFHAGADTTAAGPKCHDYPEAVYIISGQLYDAAFDQWLEAGHDASPSAGGNLRPLSRRGNPSRAGVFLP